MGAHRCRGVNQGESRYCLIRECSSAAESRQRIAGRGSSKHAGRRGRRRRLPASGQDRDAAQKGPANRVLSGSGTICRRVCPQGCGCDDTSSDHDHGGHAVRRDRQPHGAEHHQAPTGRAARAFRRDREPSRSLARLASVVNGIASSGTTDATIRQQITFGLSNKAWSPRDFNVVARDGVVELWGKILDERERQAAKVAVENVAGAKAINDQRVSGRADVTMVRPLWYRADGCVPPS
jgi:hypothetical protein